MSIPQNNLDLDALEKLVLNHRRTVECGAALRREAPELIRRARRLERIEKAANRLIERQRYTGSIDWDDLTALESALDGDAIRKADHEAGA